MKMDVDVGAPNRYFTLHPEVSINSIFSKISSLDASLLHIFER